LKKDVFSKDLIKKFIAVQVKKGCYFRMPKVASESIEAGVPDEITCIPHSLSPESVRHILKMSPHKFRFTFVRHPLFRFISAYKWAIREDINPLHTPLDIIQKDIILNYSNINDFIHDLPNIIDNEQCRMVHFIRQSDWIYNESDKVLLDFVGKFESLNDGIATLKELHSVNIDASFGKNSKSSNPMILKNSFEALDSFGVSHSSISKLISFYQRDFELLNYVVNPS